MKELATALKTWSGPKGLIKGRVEVTIPAILDRDFGEHAHGSKLLYLVEQYEERTREALNKATQDKVARKEKAAKDKQAYVSKREQELEEAHVAAEADWQALKTKLEESKAELKSQLKLERAERGELETEVQRLRESLEAAMVARQAKAELKEAEELRVKLRDRQAEVSVPFVSLSSGDAAAIAMPSPRTH